MLIEHVFRVKNCHESLGKMLSEKPTSTYAVIQKLDVENLRNFSLDRMPANAMRIGNRASETKTDCNTHDYVNSCDTSPVLFLEGIYVTPAVRRRGVAKALFECVERWGASRGCEEFASDTDIDNIGVQALHVALGFEETERVVYFRKRIRK